MFQSVLDRGAVLDAFQSFASLSSHCPRPFVHDPAVISCNRTLIDTLSCSLQLGQYAVCV